MTCPHAKGLRGDLPPLIPRIAKLQIDPERGYPVPWFVQWIDGKPEFRLGDSEKYLLAIKQKLCWVCGESLALDGKGKLMHVHDRLMAFVIGPMCCINRISGDPPSHPECAEWSVKGCPFLAKPQMVRREDEQVNEMKTNVGGEMIERNPGVALLWITKSYSVLPDGRGKFVLKIGDPESLSWWREGRTATRQEILNAIDSGLPFLKEKCEGVEDMKVLDEMHAEALRLLPA